VIKPEVDQIESLIRQDLYSTIQDFQGDLEKLKKNYTEMTKSISYVHKELVLRNVCEKLIMKAFEGIYRREKDQLVIQSRAQAEKMQYLDQDLKRQKQESEAER